MEIRSFRFDRALSRGFAKLCGELYANEKQWIPPLRRSLLAQFAPDYPFYQKLGNQHRHFVALQGNRVIGHASALLNRDLHDSEGRQIGCLGFFECVEDYTVAKELLDHALEYLKQCDAVGPIWGPINFDIWHGYRCMRRGFNRELFLGEPFNKSYYPQFFERFGFVVRKTWCSTEITDRRVLEDLLARLEPRYRRIIGAGYRFGNFDGRDGVDLRTLHALISQAYERFLGFTAIDFTDFNRMFLSSLKVLDLRFVTLIFDPRDRPAGFSIAYPDPANAVRAMRGKDDPYAKLQFALRRKGADRAVYHMVGITPEEVEKRHGLGSAASFHTFRTLVDAGFDTIVTALISDDSLGRSIVGNSINQADREYVLYELK